MSYLELFLVFLKIGFIMFGGGYGGIGIYYRILVEEKKWISEEEFLSIIGIAESTPGPIAINAATWIGYELKGLPGSLIATFGVVLPSYIIILGIVTVLRPFMDHYIAKAFFRGVNAAVLAIILYAFLRLASSMMLKTGGFDYIVFIVFIVAFAILFGLKVNPVLVIILSAATSLVLKILFNI